MLPDGNQLLSLRLTFDIGRLLADIYGFEIANKKTGAPRNTSTSLHVEPVTRLLPRKSFSHRKLLLAIV